MSSLLPAAGPNLPAMDSLPPQARSVVVASNTCVPEADEMLSLQEDNVLAYIAGYIVRRLRHKLCTECQEKVVSTTDTKNQNHDFLVKKSYAGAKHGLTVPSDKTLDTVKQRELELRKAVVRAVVADHVKQTLASELSKNVDVTSLACTLSLASVSGASDDQHQTTLSAERQQQVAGTNQGQNKSQKPLNSVICKTQFGCTPSASTEWNIESGQNT